MEWDFQHVEAPLNQRPMALPGLWKNRCSEPTTTKEIEMIDLNVRMISERGGHRAVLTADRVRIETPPVEHLAFYVGLGALAAVEIVEWPLALLLMTGHLLMDATNRPALHQLGEAMEGA
jgi:hypothetical protein